MGKMSISIYAKGCYEEFHALETAKKQTQVKAKQSQSVLAPRPALGVEKTKPIYERPESR
jgi:hypothetical protein